MVYTLEERQKSLLSLAGKLYGESVLFSNLEPGEMIISDLEDLTAIVSFLKVFGADIVLTMGTFDLLHVGHAEYIRKARLQGKFLIVGVDDDEKARGRKGENRPAVPCEERTKLLTYLRYVNLVAIKSNSQQKWEMIRVVRPDTLVAVQGTYSEEEISRLKEFCGQVVVLPRQAETSTSARVRKIILDGADIMSKILSNKLLESTKKVIQEAYKEMKEGKF